jgi:prevent-host-death family protein
MLTYTIEAAEAQIATLIQKAAHGEAVIITDHDKPIAKLVPADEIETNPAGTYRERVRALRGSAKGIDTTVERDEDRV